MLLGSSCSCFFTRPGHSRIPLRALRPWLIVCALWLGPLPALAAPLPWTELESGLEYAEFAREDDPKGTLVFLRFNPASFDFSLHSISEEGGPPLTLRQWADKHRLVAAINASMYLTDGRTSTGYMRHGEHINSKRVVGRFGAFFVSGLLEPAGSGASPPATLLDKDMDPWEEELPKYRTVVQNYRMINGQRRVLWSPGGPLYSISAVGKDGEGKILFIHCREPIEAFQFATLLLRLPIDVRTVMYVEGGAQAGLLVNSSKYTRAWAGHSPMNFLITGNLNAPLPNILGVTRRELPPQPVQQPESATPQPAPTDEKAAPAAPGSETSAPAQTANAPAPIPSAPAIPAPKASATSAPETSPAEAPARPAQAPGPAASPPLDTPPAPAPKAVTPDAVAPEAIAPEAIAPEAIAPETAAPDAATPEVPPSQAAAPEAARP